ncbi:hypothetical protein [Sinomonas sp. ASV322]|uniref:hypothetical protein n=1 Tax=Sinomonas sp. ASV322 TaxID=3041920 RepID=UPI0027DB74D9|nr:hypothetical protein [Sinomonas sp. ASV322]MDQ4501396.1 hypothetical protein [Sinomonas sp. ASV322]
MRVALDRVGSLVAVLALVAFPLTACAPFSTACSAVGYVSAITITFSPDRISTLDPASLQYRSCQDGACQEGHLPLSPQLVAPPISPSAASHPAMPSPGAVPQTFAIVNPPTLTTSPVDLTVWGKTTDGQPVGPLHATITPKVDYPDGPYCGQRITGGVRWDLAGLHVPVPQEPSG